MVTGGELKLSNPWGDAVSNEAVVLDETCLWARSAAS